MVIIPKVIAHENARKELQVIFFYRDLLWVVHSLEANGNVGIFCSQTHLISEVINFTFKLGVSGKDIFVVERFAGKVRQNFGGTVILTLVYIIIIIIINSLIIVN